MFTSFRIHGAHDSNLVQYVRSNLINQIFSFLFFFLGGGVGCALKLKLGMAK